MKWRAAGVPSLAGVGFMLALLACGPKAAHVPQMRAGPIATQIDRFVRDSLPGFSGQIVLARNGNVLLHEAYGIANRVTGWRNTVRTLFDVGSLTKQFTSAAILAMAEDGRLSVSDTLGRFFPGLSTAKARISLHQLLTHSAGLPQYSGEDYDPMTAEAFTVWLDTVSLEFVPGARFKYSNPGYSALAIVVEKASGVAFEQFVRQRLLGRAGLRRTGYLIPKDESEMLAVGYLESGESAGTPLDHFWHRDGPSWNLRGNGGMLSAASELYGWQQALISRQVLSRETLQQMFAGHITAGRPGRLYGYGWYVNEDQSGRRFIDHTGGNGAFFALVRWYERPNVVVVVTSNAFSPGVTRDLLAALIRIGVDAG